MTVFALVDDLIFLSRIVFTARMLGLQLETVEPANTIDRLLALPNAAVLIDLNHRSGAALETIQAIKSYPQTAATRVIGYLSHVQGDLAAAARAAGCDVVMTRSAFSQQLPKLLRKLVELDSGSFRKGN